MRFLKLLAVDHEANGRLDPQQTESGINQPLPAEYANSPARSGRKHQANGTDARGAKPKATVLKFGAESRISDLRVDAHRVI